MTTQASPRTAQCDSVAVWEAADMRISRATIQARGRRGKSFRGIGPHFVELHAFDGVVPVVGASGHGRSPGDCRDGSEGLARRVGLT